LARPRPLGSTPSAMGSDEHQITCSAPLVGCRPSTQLTAGASLRPHTTVPGRASPRPHHPCVTTIPACLNPLQLALLTVSAPDNDMCHDAHVLPYTAYLRIYQPVDAFSPHERRRWEEYAASHDRPRRINALAAEHSESLGRLLTFPPRAAPSEESENAYLRRVNE